MSDPFRDPDGRPPGRRARVLRRLGGFVTPTGRGASLVAAASVASGRLLSIPALTALGLVCLAVLALAAAVVLLPVRVRALLTLDALQATVGSTVNGHVSVRNRGPLPLVQPTVSVPVAGDPHRLPLPWLGPGREVETSFELPARRRGAHRVGPVEVQREDPLGLFRWGVTAARSVEVMVRPRTVPVDPLGLGQFSDVDGVSSDQISMSDLAFHALREYVRGDDLRHVHWRSSAKADRLLVRQYHDSRRSRLTLLLDQAWGSYDQADDFELAVAAAASLAVRGLSDDLEVSLFCGEEAHVNGSAGEVMDAFCRVHRGDALLQEIAPQAAARSPLDGLVVVLTGGLAPLDGISRGLLPLLGESQVLVLRCAAETDPRLRALGPVHVGAINDLGQLPRLVEQLMTVGA